MAARVNNKRRYVRTRAQNLVAHLRVGDRTIMAPVEDVSMGGMLARTGESIAIGTAIMFDLARPGLKKPLRLLGVVVDTRIGRGLGIRFDGLDKEAADRLGDLIADLGGMTSPSNLLVDRDPTGTTKIEPPPIITPSLPQPPPTGSQQMAPLLPAPVPAPTPRMAAVVTPAPAAPMHVGPSENEVKLQGQMRSMVMELGRLQELVQQREKELHDARTEIARLKSETTHGEAAQRIVGRLEIEKNKLEGQLADTKNRSKMELEVAHREAEQAMAALARLMDVMNRMR